MEKEETLQTTATSQAEQEWWATGDTPVRTGTRVTYFIDGAAVLNIMCRHILRAQRYIYLACWGLTAQIELVRGNYHLMGPQGSPQQEELLETLRSEGCSEADIEFWCTHTLTMQAVLGYAVQKGVEVKVLLWHCPEAFAHYNLQETKEQLEAVGVACLLDDSAFGVVHHPAESLHQKIAVVDGTHAFVGGIDPLIEKNGDFDRWDTPMHAFDTPLRRNEQNQTPHPWHDVHSLLEGTAVGDVELNFRQRWNEVATKEHHVEELHIPERALPEARVSNSVVQVVRTIPQHTYDFDPDAGLQDIAQVYERALQNIQRFAYLENQYFWLRGFAGVDVPFMGFDSVDMEHNIRALGAALKRGAFVSLVLPDHPNVGRAFTDAGLARLRDEAPQVVEEGKLRVYCLATSMHIDDKEHYRPIYVHAKVLTVDDRWSTVGSANLNNRGMRDDTELNVAVLDNRLAHNLRLMLQGEHLGLLGEYDLFAMARLIGQQFQTKSERERA
ncbi:MAG TPA: phospholipase D family protein, partial [Ktedonobacteraceae bacterium]